MYFIVDTGSLHIPGLPAPPGGPCGPAKAMHLELELNHCILCKVTTE